MYATTSNSGNISFPIKFKILFGPELNQMIFEYIGRICRNNNVRKTIPYSNNSITKRVLT